MRDRVATALQAIGASLVAAAAFTVSTSLGLFTSGLILVAAGIVFGLAGPREG